MRYEEKAALQDGNKARIYEERYKKWRKKKTKEMYEEKKIKDKLKTYSFINYDYNEKEFVSTKVVAKNLVVAIDDVKDLPISDTHWTYHGNKKPKLKGIVINLIGTERFI